MQTLAIDFVRQVIEQTLYEEHLKNSKYFGGKNLVNLFSFYEQLEEGYEVDRFKELYKDLVEEQNRSGIPMNGTIVAPENPQIMNINSATIIPLTFTCSFRTTLADRDQVIETIDNLMTVLKGRKRDVACFSNGKLFMVGTIANNVLGTPLVQNGDFIGTINTELGLTTQIEGIISALKSQFSNDITIEKVDGTCYFVEDETHHLRKVVYVADDEEWVFDDLSIVAPAYDSTETYTVGDVVSYNGAKYKAKVDIDTPGQFNQEHWKYICIDVDYSTFLFDKYKVSISFDTIRIDEPKTTNAQEYCTISFGGSATVCNGKVRLGNDLTKLSIQKTSVKLKTGVFSITDTKHWLEPLEMPSGLGISSEITQLASHNFVQGKHNDGINPSRDYSFVLDDETLVDQFFNYARYGEQGTYASSYTDGVTPNMLFTIVELWSSWGVANLKTFKAKATENIDVENTESDALTIKLTFELQKD